MRRWKLRQASNERKATGEQAIQQQTDGQAWETLLQALCQAVEGFEFAVLFGGVLAWVLDELGHDGESEAVWSDQLGFQHGVIIGGLTVVSASQAMGTMPLREDEPASAIDGDREVTTEP